MSTLHCEDHGSGRPVVFLHGFGASLETWRDIQPAIAGRVRASFVDLKGFGLSPKPRDDRYTISDQAALVAELIAERRLLDCAVVGHSYGGAVGLLTYLRLRDAGSPYTPSRLVLINAAAHSRPLPLFVRMLATPIANALLLQVPAHARARLVLLGLFHDRRLVTRERVDRVARFLDLPGAHHSFVTAARQIVAAEADKFRSRLRQIDVPTLIIWGRNDRALPIEYATYFAERIRDSRLAWIDECDHIPQEEKPVECTKALLEFLC